MIEDVLAFWFGEPAATTEELGRKMKRWYMGGPELDAEIRQRFGALVEQALAGELDHWAETIEGRLALILLLDQFTRSIYRNDRKTYAGDAKAQALAVEALDRGLDKQLPVEQRNFMLMPLAHAESVALQERNVTEMDQLYADAAGWQQKILAMGVEQSHKYRDLIVRFGRFPHRNELLGRQSTQDEKAFLVDWEHKMRPSGAKDL